MKKAVILLGPPGGGKGTQAEKIAEAFGLTHIETSKIIERGFASANPNDPKIKEAKRQKLEGKLTSPKLFAGWFNDDIGKLAEERKGMVASGSLRTIEESELILPILEKLYGKENIKIFLINISEQESIKRNSKRRVCEAMKHTIPSEDYHSDYKDITACPQDGSPLIFRTDDKPDIIKKRYGIYLQETTPVFDYLRGHNYEIVEVHGERGIDTVFADIKKHLK